MEEQGYRTNARSKTPYSLDSWVFSYPNLGGNNDTITIEINYSLRSHLLPAHPMPLTLPFLAGSVPILCLDAIEIYAGKITALLNRSAARDLFDIVNMINSDLIDESQRPLLRKACVFYAAISSKRHRASSPSLPSMPSQAKTSKRPFSRFFLALHILTWRMQNA